MIRQNREHKMKTQNVGPGNITAGHQGSILYRLARHKSQALLKSTALATTLCLSPGISSGQTRPVDAAPPAASASKPPEEIVVTSTRRSERVLKVPYNISALSGSRLKALGITDVTGLRNAVPGLASPDYGERGNSINNNFIIRGVNTSSLNSLSSSFPNLGGAAVSTYVDETPLFVNLKLDDVSRIEVLRGPQGTLFGAGSVGGTIRTIHNAPQFDSIDYQFSAAASGSVHAGEPNYDFDGVVNLPITSNLALRVSGGYDDVAGVIDGTQAIAYTQGAKNAPQPVLADPANALTSPYALHTIKGVDASRTWHVRADALWNVTDDLAVELAYQHQNDHSDGFTAEYPGADYDVYRRNPETPSTTVTNLYSVRGTKDFGFATVTSSSSYYDVNTVGSYDNTGIVVTLPYYYGGYPRLSDTDYNFYKDHAFTEELRLVSAKGGLIDYVTGFYYQDRSASVYQYDIIPGIAAWSQLPGSGTATNTFAGDVPVLFGGTPPGDVPGVPVDTAFDFARKVRFTDLAIFGELTYHITNAWRLTGGARGFKETFDQSTTQHYYFAGTTFGSDALGTSTGNGNKSFQDGIIKLNTNYDISKNQLAYFTFSQGFRAGGANAFPEGTCGLCNSPSLIPYKPDRANNYEIGLKGRIGSFTYSTALYDIQWRDIQLLVSSTAGTPIVVNGGGASSRGFELETSYQAGQFSLTGGYSYTDAALGESFTRPGGFTAFAGTQLPGVSEHQVSLSADYGFPLPQARELDLHVDGSYRSSFGNQIVTDTPAYARLDGYAIANASASLHLTRQITVQLFANNLSNTRGVTAYSRYYNPYASPAGAAYAEKFDPVEFISHPLTIGLRVNFIR